MRGRFLTHDISHSGVPSTLSPINQHFWPSPPTLGYHYRPVRWQSLHVPTTTAAAAATDRCTIQYVVSSRGGARPGKLILSTRTHGPHRWFTHEPGLIAGWSPRKQALLSLLNPYPIRHQRLSDREAIAGGHLLCYRIAFSIL